MESTHFLHEVLFALYGIRSVFNSQHTAVKEKLSETDLVILNKILKIGAEFSEIVDYISKILEVQWEVNELYLVSFAENLDEVLNPYRQDIVVLEQDILKNPNYKFTYIWSKVERYNELFCSLNSLIHTIVLQNSRGCFILQHLHEALSSAVGVVNVALSHIICGVNTVFYRHLSRWLLDGELLDSGGEFFVMKNSKDSENTLYKPFEEYSINHKMLPGHIDISIAEKILKVGQIILIIKTNPHVNSGGQLRLNTERCEIFGDKKKDLIQKLTTVKNVYAQYDVKSFEKIVGEVSTCVTSHLWKLAVQDAALTEQIHLVKDFFLLGRGELFHDFIAQADIFLKKRNKNPQLELNIILQESSRKVLLKEEYFQRFSLEIIKPTSEEGRGEKSRSDWSCITIKYDVPWPLQLLFTPQVLTSYNNIFKFLLQLKRFQIRLQNSWLHGKARRHLVPGLKQGELRHNLSFLINNLQYYLQVDVLDSQFMILDTTIQNSKDFDEILRAHTVFLDNILSQSFIHAGVDPDEKDAVFRSINNCLSLCEEFLVEDENCGSSEMDPDIVNSLLFRFEASIEYLLTLLTGFSKKSINPCSQYLSQFLLRLDFNSFFSTRQLSNVVA